METIRERDLWIMAILSFLITFVLPVILIILGYIKLLI